MINTEKAPTEGTSLSFAQVAAKDLKKAVSPQQPNANNDAKKSDGGKGDEAGAGSEKSPMKEAADGIANSVSHLSLESQDTSTTQETHEISDENELEFGLDGCNIFVGDLAKGITEEQIEAAFSACGKVASVSIKRDKQTGKNLGYGFVRMCSKEEALVAKRTLHQTEIQGRKVRLGWAQKNTSLFVGGLGEGVTMERFKEVFQAYGPLEEEQCYVKGRFGFAKFKYRVHAEAARRALHGAPAAQAALGAARGGGGGGPLKVEWNSSGPAGGHGGGAGGGAGGHRGGGGGGAGGGMGGGGGGGGGWAVHVRFLGEPGASLPRDALPALVAAAGPDVAEHLAGHSQGPLREKPLPAPAHAAAGAAQGAADGKPMKKVFGYVYFTRNRDGERAAAKAVEELNGTTFNGFKVECSLSTPKQQSINRGGGKRAGGRRGGLAPTTPGAAAAAAALAAGGGYGGLVSPQLQALWQQHLAYLAMAGPVGPQGGLAGYPAAGGAAPSPGGMYAAGGDAKGAAEAAAAYQPYYYHPQHHVYPPPMYGGGYPMAPPPDFPPPAAAGEGSPSAGGAGGAPYPPPPGAPPGSPPLSPEGYAAAAPPPMMLYYPLPPSPEGAAPASPQLGMGPPPAAHHGMSQGGRSLPPRLQSQQTVAQQQPPPPVAVSAGYQPQQA